MKKRMLIIPAALALLGCSLSSCNQQIIDLTLKFEKVHVFEVGKCYPITSWTDYADGDQLQVDIAGCGKVLFHSNQVALIQHKCPFCD